VAAERGIDLAESYAYSDSATDEPMLRIVGHPNAVNPDRELARIAALEGWPVLQFTNRVPLRDRVNMPPPKHLVAGATLAAGLAASLVLGWWIVTRRRAPGPTGVRRPGASSPQRRRVRPRR
jgi:hypothetical protein